MIRKRELKQLSSLQNPLIKELVKLRKEPRYRKEKKTVIIEGRKMIDEVCASAEARVILTTDSKLIGPDVRAQEIYLVTPEIIEKIAGTRHPEGIIAEVPMPTLSTLESKRAVVVLDGVSDPGNLGTLLRTALALGWEGAFILENSCDPFNDKALRAAKGATFRLPIRIGTWLELETLIAKEKLHPFCADIEGTPVDDIPKTDRIALVLGNESTGLSKEAFKVCKKVTIPMSGQMESLNVSIAGGVLMYALRKGR